MHDHPPSIEWLDGQFAPAGVPETAPLVTCLSSALEMALSKPTSVEGVTYGADMRHFVNTGGMPCVMFGAGDVRLAHAPDESIPIAELLQAVVASAFFIAAWCGVSPD
jgi:acetylornithine deacetylase